MTGQTTQLLTSNVASALNVTTATATALSALTNSFSALVASVSGNTALITTEQTARANADGALATAITTLTANGPTGYAAVVSSASASASAITGLQANYTLKVDTSGHVAGMTLASGGSGSSVVFLADKFAFVRADGSGGTVNVMTEQTIGGVNYFGLNGNVIVKGTVIADALAVTDLSSIRADLGTVTAGRAQNTDNSNFIDFNATLTSPFLKVGSNVTINADGSGVFSRVVLSAPNVVYTNTFDGISLAPNQWARIYIETVSASSAALVATGYPNYFYGDTGQIAAGGRFIMEHRIISAAGFGGHSTNYPTDSDGALFLDAGSSGYSRTINGGVYVDIRFIPVAGYAASITITNFHIDVLRT